MQNDRIAERVVMAVAKVVVVVIRRVFSRAASAGRRVMRCGDPVGFVGRKPNA